MQKSIIGEVRTAEGVRRGTTYKVGSQKSPEGSVFYKLRSRGGGILYPTNIIKNRIEIYLIEVWKKFLCDKKKLEKVGCVLIVRGDFFLILQHYLKALL